MILQNKEVCVGRPSKAMGIRDSAGPCAYDGVIKSLDSKGSDWVDVRKVSTI